MQTTAKKKIDKNKQVTDGVHQRTGKSSKPKMSKILIDRKRSPLLMMELTRFTNHPNKELATKKIVQIIMRKYRTQPLGRLEIRGRCLVDHFELL